MKCRSCGHAELKPVIDLGTAPPSNAYLSEKEREGPELFYPLRILICDACWLMQTEDFLEAERLFAIDYAYFSSFSQSWLAHARHYVDTVLPRFVDADTGRVVEIAANDGYLLQYVKARGIDCLGVEPTASTAAAAREKGISVVEAFFDEALARRIVMAGGAADLVIANNVLAHVPDINGFLRGFPTLMKPDGVASFEFPEVLALIENRQFDTLYHEHYSYLSLTCAMPLFARSGLRIFDLERLSTHGGSLRLYAERSDTGTRPVSEAVERQRQREAAAGVCSLAFYHGLAEAALTIKRDMLRFLLLAQERGETVAAYGAAAKGNTLLNYAGVRQDLLCCVADANPAKQGRFLPGSRIPIVAPETLFAMRPDHILLLPWNLRQELAELLRPAREWGASLWVAVPRWERVDGI